MTEMFVLAILAIIASIPITALMTHHQRKMAAILNAQRSRAGDPDALDRLTHEVSELRQLLAQQAIVLDDINSMHRRLLERQSDTDSIRERLTS